MSDERDYTPRRGADGRRAPLPRDIRKLVLARDGSCRKCGDSNGLEIHHMLEVVHGGTDHPDNLIALCSGCHDEWTYVAPKSLPFQDWLAMPSAATLLNLFAGHLPATMTAQAWQLGLLATWTNLVADRRAGAASATPECP